MTHHPHVHMIVPGGGLSDDGAKWIAAKPDFLVHVNVLRRLLRGKVLGLLTEAHAAGRLQFFGNLAPLADKKTFKRFLAPLRRIKWVVYCKEPFAGPEAVLRYLSRYTHRVAISNRRLIVADDGGVSFRWKDYRIVPEARLRHDGPGRWKTMTLGTHEFIRRFRRTCYRRASIASATTACSPTAIALEMPGRERLRPWHRRPPERQAAAGEPRVLPTPCPCCGGRMHVIEVFARGTQPRHRSTPMHDVIRFDTS
jgi:hypothetical protein